jgi:hypothetical protein
MVRGQALREFLVPLLDRLPLAAVDAHTFERYQRMKEKYRL